MNVKKSSILTSMACAVALTLASAASSQANLLTNPGFETGDITGWNSPNGWSSASTDYAQSGTFSGLTDSTAAGAWAVPQLFQDGFAASPGDEFNFNGYALNGEITDGSFGLLKIVFRDIGGNDLDGGTASIGTWVGPANPGAESGQINSGSPVGQWNFLEVQATAPAGTASAVFLALNVNQGLAPALMYFDTLEATLVPEPTTFALAGLGAAALLIFRRRS